MATLISILAGVVWLASIVLAIMVLIKLFQTKGVLHGILGIICLLYAFIWGWMNTNLVGKNIMIAWTICVVLGMILYGSALGFAASSSGF